MRYVPFLRLVEVLEVSTVQAFCQVVFGLIFVLLSHLFCLRRPLRGVKPPKHMTAPFYAVSRFGRRLHALCEVVFGRTLALTGMTHFLFDLQRPPAKAQGAPAARVVENDSCVSPSVAGAATRAGALTNALRGVHQHPHLIPRWEYQGGSTYSCYRMPRQSRCVLRPR